MARTEYPAYTDDSQICLSTLDREKSIGGVVTEKKSWICRQPVGHLNVCHGIAPNSPRWERPAIEDGAA